MKKKQLLKEIKKTPGEEVCVWVEGGLFLPITKVTTFDGCVVISVKDITKVED